MYPAKVNWLNVMGNLSRNAKLYLTFCAFVGGVIPGGIVIGIWATLFNLYLLDIGMGKDLVGAILQMEFLGHGLLVFPFALLSDAIGRKKTFYLAMLIAIVASGIMLTTLNPTILLVVSFFLGAGRGAHAVVGSPFMIANSEPRDRAHLYSLAQMISQILFMAGAFAAGFVPQVLTSMISLSNGLADAYRLILFLTLPLIAVSLLPIYFITEKPDEYPHKASLRNIVSYPVIGMLVLTQGLYALGFSFIQPLFNVFFAGKFGASTEEVGFIFSMGALAAAFSALAVPSFVGRLGKVRAIASSQILGSIFAATIPLVLNLGPVASLYLFRQIMFGMAAPVKQMFSMEAIQPKERASTEGLMHFMFDVSAGIPAALAGAMMMRNDYVSPFLISAGLQTASSLIFLFYFRGLDKPGRPIKTVPATIPAR